MMACCKEDSVNGKEKSVTSPNRSCSVVQNEKMPSVKLSFWSESMRSQWLSSEVEKKGEKRKGPYKIL